MARLNQIRKELRFLRAYVVISTLIWVAVVFAAFTQVSSPTRFDEIEVKRINVVEEDGQLRLVIANQERFPDGVIDGLTIKRQGTSAGMLFYNDEGDENGGLAFAGSGKTDDYLAYSGLTLDQFKQDQIIGLHYMDKSGERFAGLQVWERPEVSAATLYPRYEEIKAMPEGAEKERALTEFRELQNGLMFGASRVFVGRNKSKAAVINLSDAKGNARIRMSVDSVGNPRLVFLDDQGKVIMSLPDERTTEKN